jgi:hypothetical protein
VSTPSLQARRVGPTEYRWAQRADALRFDELSRVRATAEKWAASLGAILGLNGTVLVIKGRDDISQLAGNLQLVVGILLAVALLCALSASFCAALAAQGTPRKVLLSGPLTLRDWEHRHAVRAVRQLRASRILSVAVVLLVATAIGFMWFGKGKPAVTTPSPKPVTVLVVPPWGAPPCGRLQSTGMYWSCRTSWQRDRTRAPESGHM